MELRTLRYFLALAQEGTVSNAAKALHVTQPTLSRQLADLERSFGKQLFERGSKRIALTDEGVRLREYAKAIVELADKAEAELSQPERAVSGDVHIGCGETDALRIVLRAAKRLRATYPDVRFHLASGTTVDLVDRFHDGRFDFLLECEFVQRPDCESLRLPALDRWGVLMRKDDPLAANDVVRVDDLADRALITSRQATKTGKLREWAGDVADAWNVVATYNLPFSGALMVEEGVGVAVCYDRLVRLSDEGTMCFRPLDPPLVSEMGLIWKKHRRLSRPATAFLEALQEECNECEEDTQ
ncbi:MULTISPECIES: LysR family transcriptional regulator [Gordonibacter]|uniref:LysR family transcriptional regulator n=1 Tax=Gordonibacter faecis TaxID=3047475 RepID=A0ABT7DNR5_9ACTN|nr:MULTISPECIES: LysR family transcriptional regulator [unclassified Gordonibacter]MDJ1651180.1 LysR family transcriptional regulator [Gordonibacter sp. KGMB12511]HIW77354.1 LysR family transcriptional regulator [Candidatus Gordonibacter avicola]